MEQLRQVLIVGWGISVFAGIGFGCSTDTGADDPDASEGPADPGADGDTDADTDGDTDTDTDAGGDSDTEAIVSSSEFEVSVHLASDENPDAPGTVGIVTWSVTDLTVERAEIRFGVDTTFGMTAPVDLFESDYRTLLLGMKPNRTYYFQVVAESAGTLYGSTIHEVETGPATNLVSPRQTVENAGAIAPGFIITESMSSFGGRQSSTVYILDADGDVVWWFHNDILRTSRAMMSYDGKSIWMAPDTGDYGGSPLQSVTLDTLSTELFEAGASHDLTIVDENTIGFIEYAEGDCGSVFELSDDGTMTEIFELSDVFPEMEPPECHMNALHYYEDRGIYTVSDRDNELFMIDRQGTVLWRLTDLVSNDLWHGEQHGHQLFSDRLILFANSGGEGFESSAVFGIDLDDGSEIFRYDPGVFSTWLGDVEQLSNGNLLVTFSIAGVIHEIDAEGNLVREITAPTMGYTSWRPTLYGPPYHI